MSLLVIVKSCIEECFGLSTQALKKINRKHFKNEYKEMMIFGKYREIAHFMYNGHNNKIMYVEHMGPQPVESLMDFFKYSFYAWLELVGEQKNIKFHLIKCTCV